MKDIFIGRPLYWLLWVMVIGVLWVTGSQHVHTTSFFSFISILAGLSAFCVAVIVFTYRHGERITRAPITAEEDDEDD